VIAYDEYQGVLELAPAEQPPAKAADCPVETGQSAVDDG
jgi:hypothetical protein